MTKDVSVSGNICCMPETITVTKNSTVSLNAKFTFVYDGVCKKLFDPSIYWGWAKLYQTVDGSGYGAVINYKGTPTEIYTFKLEGETLKIQFSDSTSPFSLRSVDSANYQPSKCNFVMTPLVSGIRFFVNFLSDQE